LPIPPEAHVTLRSDRRVEAQLEDLRALLDRRMAQLSTTAEQPPIAAKTSTKALQAR
jgi:hypothetical protein